jgi:hypothetical protein
MGKLGVPWSVRVCQEILGHTNEYYKFDANLGAKVDAKLGAVLNLQYCAGICARACSKFVNQNALKFGAKLGANQMFCCSVCRHIKIPMDHRIHRSMTKVNKWLSIFLLVYFAHKK